MTSQVNSLSEDLPRYYLQLASVNNAVWHIRDRENRSKVVVKIIGQPLIVKPILNLMNKEYGYLD